MDTDANTNSPYEVCPIHPTAVAPSPLKQPCAVRRPHAWFVAAPATSIRLPLPAPADVKREPEPRAKVVGVRPMGAGDTAARWRTADRLGPGYVSR